MKKLLVSIAGLTVICIISFMFLFTMASEASYLPTEKIEVDTTQISVLSNSLIELPSKDLPILLNLFTEAFRKELQRYAEENNVDQRNKRKS